jgi:HK97 family phage portal protein
MKGSVIPFERITPTITFEDEKNFQPSTELKSFVPQQSFADYLYFNRQYDLYAYEAIRLYTECMPFFDAVNRRSDAFASIDLKVYNNNTEEFETRPKQLDILTKPNPIQSGTSFLKALCAYFDICGEVFVIVTGDREPLELYVVSPAYISCDSYDGSYAPRSYTYSDNRRTEYFYLDEEDELGGMLRYWNRDHDRQLWHIKDFNPSQTSFYRGLSKAKPLWLAIQQYIAADTNNYSILQRGGRPSLVWSWQHSDPMTDAQFERMKEQVKAYEGAQNAGRQVIADNVKPENVALSNTEMQFKENREKVRDDIYTAYYIPLPLVAAGNMTMDNLKVSNALFWEQSILPQADFLLDELTRLLMPMYGTEELEYSYSIFDITALKERIYKEAEVVSKLGLLSDNEQRTNIGYKDREGGDQIYKPSTLVAIGEAETEEETDEETDELDEDSKAYREHLRSIKNKDGSQAFSDEYIESVLMVRHARKS